MPSTFTVPPDLLDVCLKFGIAPEELEPTMDPSAVRKAMGISRTTLGKLGKSKILQRVNVGSSGENPRYKYLTLSVLHHLKENLNKQ